MVRHTYKKRHTKRRRNTRRTQRGGFLDVLFGPSKSDAQKAEEKEAQDACDKELKRIKDKYSGTATSTEAATGAAKVAPSNPTTGVANANPAAGVANANPAANAGPTKSTNYVTDYADSLGMGGGSRRRRRRHRRK
jgi:hypothetical protein